MKLLKRLTLVINDGVIEHVFYPVFPPDRNAGEVTAWLAARAQSRTPPSR
jgi:peroxiredoxin